MTIETINGKHVFHRTITEMIGHLHAILTLDDGCSTVEIILRHANEEEAHHDGES